MSGEGVPRSDTDPGREDTAMTDQDIEARRKRDLERSTGRPPNAARKDFASSAASARRRRTAPGARPCAAKKRPADRARHHPGAWASVSPWGFARSAASAPPAPHRTWCEPCAAKKRPADRARHHPGAWASVSPWGFARSAASARPRPIAASASRAWRRAVPQAGPGTRGSGPPAFRAAIR